MTTATEGYTVEDRVRMLDEMDRLIKGFYLGAVGIGHHQFVEFAGLTRYLAEKLSCIYGDTFAAFLLALAGKA